MSHPVATPVKVYEIALNPHDLDISISGDNVVIKTSPRTGSRVLFNGVFYSEEEDNDIPEKLGIFLSSVVKGTKSQIERRTPRPGILVSLGKDPDDYEILTDCHIDIIVDGLREHDGEFKTYL